MNAALRVTDSRNREAEERTICDDKRGRNTEIRLRGEIERKVGEGLMKGMVRLTNEKRRECNKR